jgi:hypothetical protein
MLHSKTGSTHRALLRAPNFMLDRCNQRVQSRVNHAGQNQYTNVSSARRAPHQLEAEESQRPATLKSRIASTQADVFTREQAAPPVGKRAYQSRTVIVCFGFGTPHASSCSGDMLIRQNRKVCMVIMPNGLTLELTYNEGSTYGVWLLGERLLWWVVAGAA